MSEFAIGDRVETIGNGEWPDGTAGTIKNPIPPVVASCGPGEWHGPRRTVQPRVNRGVVISYYVRFDTPTDDGSGDGPYIEAEIEVEFLRPISC